MKKFIFIGRGGQGVKSSAHILAKNSAKQGLMIQAFPEYGPERMGAPVKSYVKVSKEKIRSFSPITEPDYVILIDKSLIKLALELLKPNTKLIINDNCDSSKYNHNYKIKNKVYTVDATNISLKNVGMDKPNIPLLGALSKIEESIPIKELSNTINEFFGSKGKKEIGLNNKKAVMQAYELVKE